MCQVIFSSSGLTNHMCPDVAVDQIENLLISVNEHGVSTHETLHAAYKELDKVITQKGNPKPQVVIANGHQSRFGTDVMSFCTETNLDQLILPPDTSGVTQKHDQLNQRLHSCYESKKDELFSGYSNINREGFMNILAEIWNEWATPEALVKAGKRVGISKDGLNVNWMAQDKFRQAAAILNPPTPQKTSTPISIESPSEHVRRGSTEYFKKYIL